ncbi:GPI inositol-deacylase isoform X2 [Venturia canescens]|nr:GPI inositol-deacylase isoform X2 [Venturia canescens]
MGGIVARASLLQRSNNSSENESVASLLITLASPHRPIFLPDRTIARYYEELQSSKNREFKEIGTSLVSIGGGRRDILVSTSQTIEPSADLNVVSSGIPSVWASTDHLCILWCKQLVLTIVRALFDCVDVNARPPKITSDTNVKIRALSYHLTSRILGKKTHPYENQMKFEGGGIWTENIRNRYTWSHDGKTDKTTYVMIRVGDAALPYDTISIDTINLESRNWLFACSAHAIEGNSRVCEWGWNLTNLTSLSPDPVQRRSRKSADISLDYLRRWKVSHVVVRIPVEELRNRKGNPVKIHVDLYRRGDRTFRTEDKLVAGATGLFSLLPIGRILSPNPHGSVTTLRGSLRYNVVLAGIEDALAIEIESLLDENVSNGRSSRSENESEAPQAILELIEASNIRHEFSSTSQVRTLVADRKNDGSFTKKRLIMYLTRKNENTTLRISLGAEYSYKITIRRAGIVDRVACSVRDRWSTIYPIIISLCLLGISMRLDNSPSSMAISVGIFIVGAGSLDFLFETFVALGLLHVVAVTACFLIIFSGTVTHNITARFLARIVSLPSLWFEWLLDGFNRLPILTTFILISLTSATCGAIAILLSVPLYFFKLTKMWEEYLEELFMASLRHFIPRFGRGKRKRKRRGTTTDSSTTETVNEINFEKPLPVLAPEPSKISRGILLNHLLLFVTWSFAAIPATPSALVWAKNFRYETRLTTEDPTMMVSWLVLTCWGSLGLVEIPIDESPRMSNRRLLCANILRLLAWFIAFTTALENSAYYQWTVPPLVAFAVTCLALLSLLPGGSKIENQENDRAIEN